MCKINFVSEFNCFMRYAKNNSLTGRERNLWIALFYIANDRANYNAATKDYEWPDEFFPVTIGELTLHSNLDKKSIEAIRNQLKQRGLIEFEKGKGNVKPAKYKINYLSLDVGYKIVPNNPPNVPPNNTTNTPPNSGHNMPAIYKDIDIGYGLDGKENLSAVSADNAGASERAMNDFLHMDGIQLEACCNGDRFTTPNPALYGECGNVTSRLFAMFGGRQPVYADMECVFRQTRSFDITSKMWVLDSEKVKLLTYAFEEAFRNGSAGNWRYIEAILRNLDIRGIKTADDLEENEK